MEQVDRYIETLKNWQEESRQLRRICLECGLEETYKWRHPCYAHKGKNIVIIHGFKDHSALLFFKGSLLKDSENILIQQTEHVQSQRQLRFTTVQQILDLEALIKAYIFEAVEVEKAGLKVKKKKTSDFEVPEELTRAFKENPELETAFKVLTPGRQRGYLIFFGNAKQAKTRERRIAKYTPAILAGKGHEER
ncbi:YdeI/OmpD-associated family protein [Gaetbulibacter aestuarii]|uniref:YdeI/OmpD-associated family protein n=1 Tax=Gaetbulibacter aestuarii TaxID=1502358 RepID=A0ABW7MUD5_9FLAO